MANDLTTTDPGKTRSAIRWSPPVLPTSLAAVVNDPAIWRTPDAALPVLSDADRDAAENALLVYAAAPTGSPLERITELLGAAAAAMPSRQGGKAEEELRLTVYQHALADIDVDVLTRAFAEAVKIHTFLPTPAEIREIAARLPAPRRVVRAWRLRQLLAAAPPPAEPCAPADPADVAALLDNLRARMAPPLPEAPAQAQAA